MAATLVASSIMPANTSDGHLLAFTAFCADRGRPSASPLLQLLPPGPPVQAHVSLAERRSWVLTFPLGLTVPAHGISLPPLADSLRPGEPSEPTETRRPCPGVSQDAVFNMIRASDTCAPPRFHWMTADGSGPDAMSRRDRVSTSSRRFLTDNEGNVVTIWSHTWCAPLDHSTVAPLPMLCSVSDAPCACSSYTLERRQKRCPSCQDSAEAYCKRVTHSDASYNREFTASVPVYQAWLVEQSVECEQAFGWQTLDAQSKRHEEEMKAAAAHSVDLRLLPESARVCGHPRMRTRSEVCSHGWRRRLVTAVTSVRHSERLHSVADSSEA